MCCVVESSRFLLQVVAILFGCVRLGFCTQMVSRFEFVSDGFGEEMEVCLRPLRLTNLSALDGLDALVHTVDWTKDVLQLKMALVHSEDEWHEFCDNEEEDEGADNSGVHKCTAQFSCIEQESESENKCTFAFDDSCRICMTATVGSRIAVALNEIIGTDDSTLAQLLQATFGSHMQRGAALLDAALFNKAFSSNKLLVVKHTYDSDAEYSSGVGDADTGGNGKKQAVVNVPLIDRSSEQSTALLIVSISIDDTSANDKDEDDDSSEETEKINRADMNLSPIRVRTDTTTAKPTKSPTKSPTKIPTMSPTSIPLKTATKKPTKAPTKKPSKAATKKPTESPTCENEEEHSSVVTANSIDSDSKEKDDNTNNNNNGNDVNNADSNESTETDNSIHADATTDATTTDAVVADGIQADAVTPQDSGKRKRRRNAKEWHKLLTTCIVLSVLLALAIALLSFQCLKRGFDLNTVVGAEHVIDRWRMPSVEPLRTEPSLSIAPPAGCDTDAAAGVSRIHSHIEGY